MAGNSGPLGFPFAMRALLTVPGEVSLQIRQGELEFRSGGPPGPEVRVHIPFAEARAAVVGAQYRIDRPELARFVTATKPQEIVQIEGGKSLSITNSRSQLRVPRLPRVPPWPSQDSPVVASLRVEKDDIAKMVETLYAGRTTYPEDTLAVVLTPAVTTLCVVHNGTAERFVTLGTGQGVPASMKVGRRVEAQFPFAMMVATLPMPSSDMILEVDEGGTVSLRTVASEIRVSARKWTFDPTARLSSSTGVTGITGYSIPLSRVSTRGNPDGRGEEEAAMGSATLPVVERRSQEVPRSPPSHATGAESANVPSPVAEFLSRKWAGEGWGPASSKVALRKASAYWEDVWARVRRAWPDTPSLPWTPGKDPSLPQLASLMLDPRALLLSYLDATIDEPGLFDLIEGGYHSLAGGPGSVSSFYSTIQAVPWGMETGLVWPGHKDSNYFQLFRVPKEVILAWRALAAQKEAIRWAARAVEPPTGPVSAVPSPPHLLIAYLLKEAQTGRVRITVNGSLYRTSEERLGRVMDPHEMGLAGVVLGLAEMMGLVKTEGGDLTLSASAEETFKKSAHEFAREALSLLNVDDFGRMLRGLLQALLEEAESEWVHAGAILLLAMSRYSDRRQHLGSERIVDLLWLQMRFLHVCGIVDITPEKSRRILRVTRFGRSVIESFAQGESAGEGLERASPPVSERLPAGSFRVLPNFEVTADSKGLTPEDAWALCQSAEPGSWDRLVTFRLTPRSVAEGVRSGWTSDRFIEYLTRRTGRPLPQNVEFSLRDWAPSLTPVRLRLGAWVEGDAASLARLSSEAGVAGSLGPSKEDLGRSVVGNMAPVIEALSKWGGNTLDAKERFLSFGPGPKCWGLALLSPEEMEFLSGQISSYYGSSLNKHRALLNFLGKGKASAYIPYGRENPSPKRSPPTPLSLDPVTPLAGLPRVVLAPSTFLPAIPRPSAASIPHVPEPPPQELGELELRIQDAIDEGLSMSISGKNRKGGTSRRSICPQQLVTKEGTLYLVAYDILDERLYLLRTDRIETAEMDQNPFIRRAERELAEFISRWDAEPIRG